MKIRVDLKENSYDILLECGILKRTGTELKKRLPAIGKWMIVTDEHVDALYGDTVEGSVREAGLGAARLCLKPGEATKSLSVLEEVYHALCAAGISRGDGILALGGGVIGDLAGFAASTYLRGIPYVQVPTSLLAQVDSAVGGKVAVDLPEGKNLVGSFYQPRLVLLDPDTLHTLPDRFFSDGMGEVIKYGCIRDAELFQLLSKNPGKDALKSHMEDIIARCVAIKADIVARDEHDTGERMLLNFGHTLGHAIETLQGFQGLSHGEAVAVGMHLICRLAEEKGLTEKGTADELLACLQAHRLPSSVHLDQPARLKETLGRDKKNIGKTLYVVLLNRIGESRLYQAAPGFFAGVEKWLS
jgi:3-dehydroquinate synthase